MAGSDFPLGMRLKEQAGWNQTETDWRRILDLQPDGCFVAELDGRPVGTTTTCIFDAVAWIAMVLVDRAVRGQGIGTALLACVLRFLENQKVRTVRLDATSLGQPVYRKLGFEVEYALDRYAGILPPRTDTGNGVEPLQTEQMDKLFELDCRVTGIDRRKFLNRLIAEQPTAFRVVREGSAIAAFLASRPGSQALHIGPCLATNTNAGKLLFADAQWRYSNQRVYIDIPANNHAAVALAGKLGLNPERRFLRMCLGEIICGDVDALWASSGPEKG